MQNKSLRKKVTYVSLILIVAFTNMTISPSYLALGYQSDGAYNLHPGYASSPIVENGRSDRTKIEAPVLEQLLYDPEVVDRMGMPDENVILCRNGSEVKIFYSRGVGLPVLDESVLKSVMVPCLLEDKLYFTHILKYADGSSKTNVIEFSEIDDYLRSIEALKDDRISEAVDDLKEYTHEMPGESSFIVSPTDDAVIFAGAFFSEIGAKNVFEEFKAKAQDGFIRALPFGEVSNGYLVVADSSDPKERAWAIAADMILARGYNPDDFEPVFNAYYEFVFTPDADDFDMDELDPDNSLRRLVRAMEQGPAAQNEGTMEFREGAYTYMWKDVILLEREDCQETIDDIKRIFRKVAMHDMKEHNDAIRTGEKKAKPIMPEQMPGLNPSKIRIVKLSNTLLPTDITTDDGVIRINENFVKLMYVMGEWGLKRPFGKIPMYEDNRLFHDDIIGEMYESIIYSLAIHTIRGHFPISDDGKPMFNPDEFTAQTERGRNHRYVNTLAMMYYWILLLERHQYVVPRARIFMRKYPHIFKDLTEAEHYNLPFHLMHFVDYLYNRESLPHKGRMVVATGETKESVDRIVKSYPNASSNEGAPAEDDETAMNEGDIHLHDRTFRGVYADIKGLEDEEVVSTERLIKAIFRNVAMHELIDHNNKVEDRYKMREEEMPGLISEKITFEDLSSDLMVPTDITTSDGRIRINKNFVKMMHIFMMNPENTAVGRDFSELGKTIIYSLAIHTIRGHFEIVPQGFVKFVKDEKRAQPERGHKHLYQNVLGILYYWIMVVERHYFPQTRAKEFMEENPEVFAGLTFEERRRIPWDLKVLCDKFSEAGLLRRTDFAYPTKMTREAYQNILDSYPDAVSNEGDPLKYMMLEEIAASKALFLTVLKTVMFGRGEYSPEDLAGIMDGFSPGVAKMYLDAFTEAGVVKRMETADGSNYELHKFTPKECARISDVLMGMESFGPEDVAGAKGKLLEITEARQAEILVEEVTEASESKDVRTAGDKIVIAVETDWVTGAQRNYVQEVIKATEGLKDKAPVIIVRGSGKSLARELEKTVQAEGVSLKNVVVLASSETLRGDYFRSIRAENDGDVDKAFLAEIDPSNLTGDSYVRILEMMTMAVRLAFGQRAVGYHPDIEISIINKRTVVFIPRAEPVDYEDLKEIYRNQRSILLAA